MLRLPWHVCRSLRKTWSDLTVGMLCKFGYICIML